MIKREASGKRQTSDGVRAYFGRDDSGPFISLSDKEKIICEVHGELRQDVLELFDRALINGGRSKNELKEVAVNRGPGGFSEVRGRVAVAAALASALEAGIAGCGNESAEQVAEMPASAFVKTKKIVPLYDGAPNITKSKPRTVFEKKARGKCGK